MEIDLPTMPKWKGDHKWVGSYKNAKDKKCPLDG